jgi:hypothetical protein
MLSYLCEKVFSGEENQIKEYSVAVDLFHRPPSFDQDSDSIVRVEANRLRKRLAAYYAAKGAMHRMQIAIPVGQYIPKFETSAIPVPGLTCRPAQGHNARGTSSGFTRMSEYPRGRAWWLVTVIAVFAMISAGSWLLFWHRHTEALRVLPQNSPATTSFTPIGPPTGEEIRILAGTDRSLVDHAGKLWSYDLWFSGGKALRGATGHIWRTLEPAFYRNSRQGDFRYDIPLRAGVYELRLYFAETAFGPEAAGLGGEGSRLMTVRANGRTLLSRFDVVADAGASRTADVRVFPGIRPAEDGLLHLQFSGDDGRQAMLSEIEILPGVADRIRPVRILARQSPYYSNNSEWWSPDEYFEGGQLAAYNQPVTGTDDPGLYETERWGNFSYAIPLSPGKYSLTLYFAVRHSDPSGTAAPLSNDTHPATHIFSVFCNGRALLDKFNLAEEAHKADVVIRRIGGLEPNAQGKLLLSFVPVDGYATVTAVEIVPQ